MHRRTRFLTFLAVAVAPLGWAQAPASPRVLPNHDQSVVQRLEVGGRVWFLKDVEGRAVVDGDIVLGPVALLRRGPKDVTIDASIVGSTHRWSGGVVPYEINTYQADNPKLAEIVQAAIKHWEERTPFRFVQHTNESNYVVFVSLTGFGCASDAVGMDGSGPQYVYLETGCFTAEAIHEIGHAVGLFHEQSRHDRDHYVEVRQDQVNPDYWDPNFIIDPNGTDFGYYDYDSIMHYGAADFSISGAPVLVTVPPAIPMGQRRALSPADIAAAMTLNGLAVEDFTVTTNPPGLQLVVDGVPCVGPCVFRWDPGSSHTVEAPSPQPASYPMGSAGAGGTFQWYFGRWNDDGARAHTVKLDANHPTVLASFTQADPANLPDLAVTAAIGPAQGAAGEVLTGMHTQIQNVGHSAAGPFRVGFYLSPATTVVRSQALAHCDFDSLPAGATAACDGAAYCQQVGDPSNIAACQGSFTVPPSITAGNYYVGVVADETFEVGEPSVANNTLSSATATAITSSAAGSADLQVTSFSAATTGVIGGMISQVYAEVKNSGLGPAGPFRLGYYLSKTTNFDTDGMYTGWSCTIDGLAPGATTVCTGDIRVRLDLAPGTWYLAAKADDLSQVAESNETNNLKLSTTGPVELARVDPWAPDLVVTTLVAPASAAIGGKLNGMMVKVQNTGRTRAGAFRVGIYLSTDGVITTGDVYLAGCNSYGLAPQAVFTCVGSIPLADTLTPGSYYVGAIADDLGSVLEVNERNNSRMSDRGGTILAAIP